MTPTTMELLAWLEKKTLGDDGAIYREDEGPFASLRALILRSEKVDDLLAAIWACREAGTLPLGIGAAYDALRKSDKEEKDD